MSTFAGLDILGSGPHRVTIGAWVAQKKRTGYAGADGVESLVFGHRGRPIMISGQLRAATVTALNALIYDIEVDILDVQGTLVDNWGESYINCEFDRLEMQGPIEYSQNNAVYIQEYVLHGVQLRSV